MYFLKDLPTDRNLREFTERYPNMNPSALKTCAELMRTGSDLLAVFETILGKSGLSQGRFLTLIVMNRAPDEAIIPSTLAQKLGVTRATMTGLLDGLEKEDLIERRAHAQDRRKVGLVLTTSGRQILDKILPDYYRHFAKLTVYLDEGERQTLVSLLKKVNQGLLSVL
ncbi:Transcriptional regulator, MarR family [Olavius sp. associated proteobacterium Delta 1]|nr:Transcriptional regulator, MarR family [Olavius sp. associated proteobacterium Delta 1]